MIYKLTKQCFSVRFCPNNDSLLAVAACDMNNMRLDGTLYIMEITPQQLLKEILRFEHKASLYDVEWCDTYSSPSLILTASGDNNMQLWNLFAPRRDPIIFSGHSNEVYTINWCKDSNRVLSGSTDFTIRLWDAVRYTTICEYCTHVGMVYEVQFHPKFRNRFASVSGDSSLKFWDSLQAVPTSSVLAHMHATYSISWSKYDENILATSGADGFVRGWDLRNFERPCFQLGPVNSPIKKVLFSPFSCDSLASIGNDGITRLWSCFEYPYPIMSIQNHVSYASGLDWNSLETTLHLRQLADCGWDGYVHIYNPGQVGVM